MEPQGTLKIQNKHMPWTDAVKGLGIWVDKGLTFERQLAEMRVKSTAALSTVAMAAELCEMGWDD